MSLNLIKQLLNENGDEHKLSGDLVIDEASGKTFSQVSAQAAATDATVEALKKTLNDFLTGEADGGDVDRLVELVKEISDNKDSIDALTSDKVAKADIVDALNSVDATKVLSAAQGKALKDLIDALDAKVDASGAISYVATADATPAFNGKLVMVVTPYTPPAEGDEAEGE